MERPTRPGARLEAVDGVGGARRRVRGRPGRGARHRGHRRGGGLELHGSEPRGEHLGHHRPGPVVHRRRTALREHLEPAAARAVRPAPHALLAGRGLDSRRVRGLLRSRWSGWRSWGVRPDDTKLPDELGVKDSTYALLAVAFLVAVVAPIAEESSSAALLRRAAQLEGPVARGRPHRVGLRSDPLRVGRGRLPAAAGVLRLSLCLLRERTGSLYPGIALHCMNNSLAFGVSPHWGWQIPVLFVCGLGLFSLVGLAVRAVDARAGAHRLSAKGQPFGRSLRRYISAPCTCRAASFRPARPARLPPSSSSWPCRAPPPRRRGAAVAHARAREQRPPRARGQPWRVRVVMQPWVEGQTGRCASIATATSCAWSTST